MKPEAEKMTRKLRLPWLRNNWEEIVATAERDRPGYEEFLYSYLEEEYRQREERGFRRKSRWRNFLPEFLWMSSRENTWSLKFSSRFESWLP